MPRFPEVPAYAASDAQTRGRCYAEPAPKFRGEYQRDRDRIIHSAAFRRLEYKTQVFINHEGDLYRTRLTHSLEVAQIARSIARALGLNEDLTEAVSLAHDLGHTPFGHAGQDALNDCMKPFGGFEHNRQSLRVVDQLEKKYADFNGLNLTFETREGILKHCSKDWAVKLGEVGRRFLEGSQPTLEAQLCNLADEIAYNNHDIDDGLRSGLIGLNDLRDIALFNQAYEEVRHQYGDLDSGRLRHEIIRRMINRLVTDVIETSTHLIHDHQPQSVDDVRSMPRSLIAFSEPVRLLNRELKRFLNQKLYHHYHVERMTTKAKRIVTELFNAFWSNPKLLPSKIQHLIHHDSDPNDQARTVTDYIASMTDRFAHEEHQKLFDFEIPG